MIFNYVNQCIINYYLPYYLIYSIHIRLDCTVPAVQYNITF